MTTRHLVDPELLPLLDSFPSIRLDSGSLPAARAAITAMLARRPLPELPVDCSEVFVAADDDRAIRCLLVRPRSAPVPTAAVLHMHGGGHVLGAPEMDQPELMAIAAELNCLVLSVDYRLAPETRFPGAIEDCYAALDWLHRNATALAIDAHRIAVAGESAGGGLAAGLCLMARDRGGPSIAFQLLDAPKLDDRTCLSTDPNRVTGEFVWTREHSHFCWNALLGHEPGGNDTSSYAAPMRAADVSGLPPALLCVGTLDLFVDEVLHYARRLIRAGVATELLVYPGAFHGFAMAHDAAVARRLRADKRRALAKAFGQPA